MQARSVNVPWRALLVGLALALSIAPGMKRITDAARSLQGAGFVRTDALAAAAVEAARRQRVLWLHTDTFLERARRAHAAGEWRRASSLAATARREALLALNQARLERARYAFDLQRGALPPGAAAALEKALHLHAGAAALSEARRLGLLDER